MLFLVIAIWWSWGGGLRFTWGAVVPLRVAGVACLAVKRKSNSLKLSKPSAAMHSHSFLKPTNHHKA
jgi:hypothetical protein